MVEKDYISIPLSLAAIKHITEILAESVGKNIVNEDLSEVKIKKRLFHLINGIGVFLR